MYFYLQVPKPSHATEDESKKENSRINTVSSDSIGHGWLSAGVMVGGGDSSGGKLAKWLCDIWRCCLSLSLVSHCAPISIYLTFSRLPRRFFFYLILQGPKASPL